MLSPPPCVRVRVLVWQRNICAYAVVIVVKMAEGETEKEYDTRKAIEELRERFQGLTAALKESSQSPLEASLHFCQEFCQVSPFSCCPSRVACSPSGFLAEDARLRLLQQCSKGASRRASCLAFEDEGKKLLCSFQPFSQRC